MLPKVSQKNSEEEVGCASVFWKDRNVPPSLIHVIVTFVWLHQDREPHSSRLFLSPRRSWVNCFTLHRVARLIKTARFATVPLLCRIVEEFT